MLKLIEHRPGRPTSEKMLSVSDLPLTIGKGKEADIKVALGVPPEEPYSRHLSRVQATLYKKGEELFIKDGASKPSANGIYYKGRRTYTPIQLYPGIEVELFPKLKAYHLVLTWPLEKEDFTEADTAILERDNLEGELKVADQKVEELTWTVSELKTQLIDTVASTKTTQKGLEVLRDEVSRLQVVNKRQDRRLKLLKKLLIIFCVVSFAATWLMLGGDQETLAIIGKTIISIASFVGLFFGIKTGDVDI